MLCRRPAGLAQHPLDIALPILPTKYFGVTIELYFYTIPKAFICSTLICFFG
ncbi:conserved protein of unknown function; putative nudix hydrolase domain [Microscilla marina ATCC 23134]|uniref:Uncharacterized protein n=1 Tax=Microscilla marina ATCC 23134 TaxID=313606 RepID=A1ZC40_MICM2|nr:conserved protein of unknown function; putative nudix hydrolase domain [Microscilla marina ATCC 23134]